MYLKPRWVLTLKIFADTFHGSYKDGTNGTKDFRQVAGIIFIILIVQRAAPYEIYALTIPFHLFPFELALQLLATAMCIACGVFPPYKHRAANISVTILFQLSSF